MHVPSPTRLLGRASASGRGAVAALATVVTLLSVGARAEEPTYVLLEPVTVHGFADETDLGPGLTQMMLTRLRAAGLEPVLERSTAASPGLTLRGSLTRLGTSASLDLTLLEPRTSKVVWSGFSEGPDLEAVERRLPSLAEEAARAVRATAGGAPVPSSTVPSAPDARVEDPGGVDVAPVLPVPTNSTGEPEHGADELEIVPVEPSPATTESEPPVTPTAAVAARPSRDLAVELALVGLDLCDLDDDGTLEVVVADGDGAAVLDGFPESLAIAARWEGGWFDEPMAVDCVDADGDGVLDVVVTNRRHGSFRSLILDRTGGELVPRADDLSQALRAVPAEPGGRRLMAQRFPVIGRLYGPVQPARLDGNQLVLGDELALPEDANLGALALGEALGAPGLALTIDHTGRLGLYDGTHGIVDADGRFGGFDQSFEDDRPVHPGGTEPIQLHLRDRIEVARTPSGPVALTTRIDSPYGDLLPRVNLGKGLLLEAFQVVDRTLRPVPLPFPWTVEGAGDATLVDYRVLDATGDGRDDLVLGLVVEASHWYVPGSESASRIVVVESLPGE